MTVDLFTIIFLLGATIGDQHVISTTGDLLKFDEAFYSGKLLNSATMEEAFTPVKLNGGETYYGETETAYASHCSYGLGWIVCDDPKIGRLVSHDGYNRGIATMFYRNITKRQTVIMFDNTEGDNFNEKIASVVNILNGKAPLTINLKNSAVREFGETLLKNGIEPALIRFMKSGTMSIATSLANAVSTFSVTICCTTVTKRNRSKFSN